MPVAVRYLANSFLSVSAPFHHSVWLLHCSCMPFISDIIQNHILRLIYSYIPQPVRQIRKKGCLFSLFYLILSLVKEGSEFNQLGQSSLARFQTRWKEIKLLILDEKSMVGRSGSWPASVETVEKSSFSR